MKSIVTPRSGGRQGVHCSTKSWRISPFNADLGKRRGNAAAIAACLPLPLHPSPKCDAANAAAQAQYPRRKRQLPHPRGLHHPASPWHPAIGTPAPDTTTAAQGASVAGVGPVPETGATDEPPRLVWPSRPCTVMADAMRPVRGAFISPDTIRYRNRRDVGSPL